MTARIHVLKLELWIGTFGLGGIVIKTHTDFTFPLFCYIFGQRGPSLATIAELDAQRA